MSKSRELIIAIDGPSGAGKSTLSRLLAANLNYINIDTGAMYRAVALASMSLGVSPIDTEALSRLARSVKIRFHQEQGIERVFLNERDVTEEIRSPEVSILTSRIAAVPQVRHAMVDLQRKLGEGGGVVLEGRDIGTVVFPEAEVKFFLLASSRERGRRRFQELKAKGMAVDLEKTIAEVEARDRADAEREHSPLRQPADALVIDTDGVGIDEVLEKMLQTVEERRRTDGFPGGKGGLQA